jgi:acyl carrier protein
MLMQEMRTTLREAIYGAIDDLNDVRAADAQVGKSLDTCLTGADGALDSLGFVNFVVALEQRLDAALGTPISLLDAEQLDPEAGPFRTVESLIEHLEAMHRSRVSNA